MPSNLEARGDSGTGLACLPLATGARDGEGHVAPASAREARTREGYRDSGALLGSFEPAGSALAANCTRLRVPPSGDRSISPVLRPFGWRRRRDPHAIPIAMTDLHAAARRQEARRHPVPSMIPAQRACVGPADNRAGAGQEL